MQRREQLLALSRRHGVLILEDDPYDELRYRGTAIAPLASLDESGLVIYLEAGDRASVTTAAASIRAHLAARFAGCTANVVVATARPRVRWWMPTRQARRARPQ